MEPIFFPTPADFRQWLEQHHEHEKELLVGYYKKGTGRPSMTWPESVEEALCFGWIDGVRKSIDDERYMIRFTPRKPSSIWSAVNIANVEKLIAQGRMQPAGLRAFALRKEDKSGIYSFERTTDATLEPAEEQQFRANAKAWEDFQSRAPSYRKAVLHWIISAKKPETRARRLVAVITESENGKPLKQFTSPAKRPKAGD